MNSNSGRRRKRKWVKIVFRHSGAHILLIALSAFFAIPFVWQLSTSLKTPPQLFVFPPIWIPNPVKWSNYSEALAYIPFFTQLKNTVYISAMSVLGAAISCPLVAYSFSRIKWAGRNVLFFVLLATIMLPYQVLMIPLFVLFTRIGWVNTFNPLIVPHFFANAFFVFLLRQFFMTIPSELSDAARIDGANEFNIFLRVILPLAKPAIAVIVLFQLMGSWSDFLGPLIYLRDTAKYTLSLGLQYFQLAHTVEWSMMMAISVLITVPIIVAFFFTQKTFIQGINVTGLKE